MLSVRSLQQVWVVFADVGCGSVSVSSAITEGHARRPWVSVSTLGRSRAPLSRHGHTVTAPPQIVLAVKSTLTYARSRAYAQRKSRRMSSRSNISQPAILLMPVADQSRATHFPLELDGGPGYRRVLRLRKR